VAIYHFGNNALNLVLLIFIKYLLLIKNAKLVENNIAKKIKNLEFYRKNGT